MAPALFGGTPTTLGVDYFVALVIPTDPNRSALYVDGAETGHSTVPAADMPQLIDDVNGLLGACIGSYDDGGNGAKNGAPIKLRDFRIYDFALTPAQIATLYTTPSSLTPDLLHLKMDETTGKIAKDSCLVSHTAYHPLVNPDADVTNDAKDSKKINLFDYTTLTSQWGDNGMGMWP